MCKAWDPDVPLTCCVGRQDEDNTWLCPNTPKIASDCIHPDRFGVCDLSVCLTRRTLLPVASEIFTQSYPTTARWLHQKPYARVPPVSRAAADLPAADPTKLNSRMERSYPVRITVKCSTRSVAREHKILQDESTRVLNHCGSVLVCTWGRSVFARPGVWLPRCAPDGLPCSSQLSRDKGTTAELGSCTNGHLGCRRSCGTVAGSKPEPPTV